MSAAVLQGADTDSAEVARLREAMTATPPKAVTVTLLNYRKDGTPFWNALHIAPVRDAEGVLEYFIGVQLDVTQQQEQEHKVVQQQQAAAAVDEHAAGEWWGSAGRTGSWRAVCMCVHIRPASEVCSCATANKMSLCYRAKQPQPLVSVLMFQGCLYRGFAA